MALRLALAVFLCLAVQITLLLPHRTGAWFLSRKPTTKMDGISTCLAKRLAYYAQTTYYGKEKNLRTWSCDTCRKHLASFKPKAVVSDTHSGGRAIVGFDSRLQAIVVAFRGEGNSKNWKNSLKAKRVRPSQITSSKKAGKVHGGFLKIYYSLRPSLMDNIRELVTVHPDASFYITGHSMGGTLAILLSLDLKLRCPKTQVVVYNFGSPRLGDKTFRKFFNKHVPKAMRVVHHGNLDTVPNLLPKSSGYRHVGNTYLDRSSPGNHCYYMSVRISTSTLCVPSGKRYPRSVRSAAHYVDLHM